MKKRVFIVVFLFTSLVPNFYAQSYENTHKNTAEVRVIEAPSDVSISKTSKKETKKELRRRKNLHKSLVQRYNEGFEDKYLHLLMQNSKRIQNLQAIL